MRLLIDLQGAQGPSSQRGIGRLSRELALAMALQPRGHDIEVALNAAYARDADDLKASFSALLPKKQILLWNTPGGTADIDASSGGRRLVAEHIRAQAFAARAPDMIHVTSLFEGMDSDIVPCWPPFTERPPVVATFYDAIPLIRQEQYLEGAWRANGLTMPYWRRVQEARMCDGLLAISESSRREAIDYIAMPPADVFNIGAGVGPAFHRIALSEDERNALFLRYGVRDGFILFLGAGDIRKNEAGLLQAYGQLPESLRARHQLVIVGGMVGRELGEMSRYGVNRDDVVTVAHVDECDMPALYSACTLFVLPSLHEGFGLPAVEAMACGAPVIASNTTSLPEVVGRPDALFDPEDTADMTARIEAVLVNPDFRRSLAEHGPTQAARFTWAAVADRAWTAIEAIHDRQPRNSMSLRGSRRVLAGRKRLAFVAPLPPDESGIADYSRDLLPALGRYYDITLVSPRGNTSDPWLAANFPVITPEALLESDTPFDRILYQIGNSHFHLFQLRGLLPALPGVVVLHDSYLSGVLAFDARQPGGAASFSTILHESHGYAAVASMLADGEEEAVRRFPCSLGVIEQAVGVIQHSRHARAILAEHFGRPVLRDVKLVPHLRRPFRPMSRQAARARLGIPDDVFLVCSFGMVAPTKLPERLLTAWEQTGFDGPKARLVFVGDTVGLVERVFRKRVSRMGRAYGEVVQGRVSEQVYGTWLAAADVAVQLRAGSRGESSGALADCLAAGVPTIVNWHGAITDLPEDVVYVIPDRFSDAELVAAFRALKRDPTLGLRLGEAARAFCEAELHPGACANRYHDAIEEFYTSGAAASSVALMAKLRQSPPLNFSPQDRLRAARALSRNFPTARPPSLLLDVTELEACALDAGAKEMVRAQFLQCLRAHPLDVRVEAVRLQGGKLRLARGFAWELLGWRIPPLPDQMADVGPNSIILFTGAALTGESEAILMECQRHGARLALLMTETANHPSAQGPVRAMALADLIVSNVDEAIAALFHEPSMAHDQRLASQRV